jgi:biotin operon repressor
LTADRRLRYPARAFTSPTEHAGAPYFAEWFGLPPIMGRILAWLMICDPPEQSGAEIAAATGASRASISTNIRLLAEIGLVQRSTRPGKRTTYYRMHDNTWENVMRRRLGGMAAFRELAREGTELVGPRSQRAHRLIATCEFFEQMADAFATVPGLGEVIRR